MSTLTVYSSKKETSKVALPSGWVSNLSPLSVAQAIRVYEDRRHPGLARVKTRSEVSLTTKKMYRQKHTGNARHGAATAPIFVGGGVAHGPKGVKRTLKLTDAVKRGTLKTAISMQLKLNHVGALDVTSFKKTKDAASALGKTGASTILVALTKPNWEKAKVLRNIKGVTVSLVDNINTLEVLKNQFVFFDLSLFEKTKPVAVKTKK